MTENVQKLFVVIVNNAFVLYQTLAIFCYFKYIPV